MDSDRASGSPPTVSQSGRTEPSASGTGDSAGGTLVTPGGSTTESAAPASDATAQESAFTVSRAENYTIWASAWGQNGGGSCSNVPGWRYRIGVPSFDTSRQRDRRLVVTPRAILTGYSDLVEQHGRSSAQVVLQFWTGVWHHRYTGSGYDSRWSGWRRSYGVVSRNSVGSSTRQNVTVGSPGVAVYTPQVHDPPGRRTSPNPINNYGLVGPNDVVDFYATPQVCATTSESPSYARVDFSLIDVPSVWVALETGYNL